MKKQLILLLCLTTGLLSGAYTQNKTQIKSTVEVYYFHGKVRCATCNSIEQNAMKTIDTYFKAEKAAGTVKMIVINIDDPKNAALVEKYEVASSSLFVTRKTGGKQFTNDLTNFAFSYSRTNEKKFMEGLRDKIKESLNK